ncbi:MAG: bacteriohopanetetrol glucosamine biosynthesis glycosyltransferase HpnI [Xanthobacteraceae bacterium]|nr:bacteriohopanetetrol glucosamine biosynthesis glycosyltransferase HpnI [Xanthobacteraceae bacterium]
MLLDALLILLFAAAAAGCLYMIVAASLAPPSAQPVRSTGRAEPAVTLLKPLHGDETGLYENLASFCDQAYSGPVQIVFGVARADDPAIAAVERLRREFPGRTIELVIDATVFGTNPKVSNLINMSRLIAHDIVVIADSDIRVRPDYLSRIVSALEQRGGVVTVPYYGIATGSLWSRLAAMSIEGHFLSGVLVGSRFALSRPCLGSTIALTRQSLVAIGGFEAIADCLADDYAIGELITARGEPVSLLPFAVGHVCDERSFAQLWRHELRWAMTIRGIDPVGYLGWSVSHAFPLALIALAIGGGEVAVFLAAAALACRGLLIYAIERGYGLPPRPYWLIPLRDLLSFAVFVAGFVSRDVRWRGHRFKLESEGILIPDQFPERRPPSP